MSLRAPFIHCELSFTPLFSILVPDSRSRRAQGRRDFLGERSFARPVFPRSRRFARGSGPRSFSGFRSDPGDFGGGAPTASAPLDAVRPESSAEGTRLPTRFVLFGPQLTAAAEFRARLPPAAG